jgi:hypothetical protein
MRGWPASSLSCGMKTGQLIKRGAAGRSRHCQRMERFISLLMGEVQRLRNDEQGYGPRGKGFFAEVILPSAKNPFPRGP